MALAKRKLKTAPLASAAFATAAIIAVACGDLASSGFDPSPAGADGGAGDGKAGFQDGAAPPIPANGLVIVHAASLPAFRLCFEADRSLRPVPSDQLMPSSNIAGVEIGSAVRIDPISPAIGRVWAFPEPAIRALYPPGQAGPACWDLLETMSDAAIELGEIERDLSTGVHLLVVSGCQPSSIDPAASVERCGPDWKSDTGNVGLRVISIDAFQRSNATSLPVQIVQLSGALASRSAGRRIAVALGEIDASPEPFIRDDLAVGDVVPDMPVQLEYQPDDTASFASVGFHVSLEAPDAGAIDAGSREPLLWQSLAEIARLSSSRDVPPAWFAAASSYVLLLLGDPDIADASVDDRRKVHLLAVPVAAPHRDDAGAGIEGGSFD